MCRFRMVDFCMLWGKILYVVDAVGFLGGGWVDLWVLGVDFPSTGSLSALTVRYGHCSCKSGVQNIRV